MKAKELANIGIVKGPAMKAAFGAVQRASKAGLSKKEIRAALRAVVDDPGNHENDSYFGELAGIMVRTPAARPKDQTRDEAVPYRIFGKDLEEGAVKQLVNACKLPVSIRGALMPDAHLGYGLPIGGVLATEGTVIPYAVGVDIACRMKLSVLDIPPAEIDHNPGPLKTALEEETRFGVGVSFKNKRQHAVMDEEWGISPVTAKNKNTAWAQLGTSGSGNHFAEYGELTIDDDSLGIAPGTYLALLSHSGSRGTGAKVADHYSKLAMRIHPDLPKEMRHLAWLDLDSAEGQEYWAAMELMGRYAAANHALIHRAVVKNLGAEVLLDIENHHNFAWKEQHDGREVVVHRKGATPAGHDVLGIIPGSMATPAYVVRGKGHSGSLCSASHGAGRLMSRKQAKKRFTWAQAREFLSERRVSLMSAGLDEVPMAYKDIEKVMKAQADLVRPVAKFLPRIVKMSRG